jgi:hypothetical protein
MEIWETPHFEGLPNVGSSERLYFIVSSGFLYRWDSDTKEYVQVLCNDPGANLADAPADGLAYIRKDGQWVPVANIDPGSSSVPDKHYTYEFVNNTRLRFNIVHNLNKYVSVTVVDTGKTVFDCGINYIDLNTIEVYMNKVIPAGYVYCN